MLLEPLVLLLLLWLLPVIGDRNREQFSATTPSWRNRHPQQRHQLLYTWRMSCYSCMSTYLEDHYMYIAHLYRRPAVFSDACDHERFDGSQLSQRNCSEMCITLRMNDRVGGWRRNGYLRGCMADVLNYNETAIRGLSTHSVCRSVRMRDLFLSHERYSFEASDYVQLCSCHHGLCNGAHHFSSISLFIFAFLILAYIFNRDAS